MNDPLKGWKVGEVREIQWLRNEEPVPETHEVAPQRACHHNRYCRYIRPKTANAAKRDAA
jgi:hypothetical protein